MNELWFDPGLYAWIPGTLLGIIGGGVGGPLIGIFASRGKFKSLVLGFYSVVMGACAILFSFGISAYCVGQPYGVWYGLGFPGLLGLIIFGFLLPVVLNQYKQAELRKSIATDL
jgi:hypothetical protein